MKIESIHIGMRVRHPQYGDGTVEAIGRHTIEAQFLDGRRTLEPEASGIQPGTAQAALSGLELPLETLIRQTVSSTLDALGVGQPDAMVEQLGVRWRGGRLVLHPADSALQTKEVPLEVFFHKIVMLRNNLRVLEQKINSSDQLSAADKVEWQQYVSRCYGSLTTFNLLFKDKAGQFSSGGGAGPRI
jgi:hypothetical protein